MDFQHIAGAAFRALTARKDGPSLYDVCDPLLLKYRGGDPHLGKFYRTALGNPALRPLLRRAGLAELRDEAPFAALRDALVQARDDESPDWAAIGQPVAALLDSIELAHPPPGPVPAPGPRARPRRDRTRDPGRGAHLLRSFGNNGFIPTYAAFNLIGDADLRGRELLMALTGLNSRGYKNSTLLFNLARIFIARSPARALINPPWTGIAEPMWQPMQIRHRSAYYDAFFTEALLSFVETGLASAEEAAPPGARSPTWSISASSPAARKCAGATAAPSASSPRWRRCRIRASPASSPRSSRTSASASMCPIATPPPVRSRRRPRPARPIRSSTSRCSTSMPAIRSAAAPTTPLVTVPLNDNIDYDGGVVTWIDNAAGERPFGNDLDPTFNLDILEVSFRNLSRWKVIETPQRLATVQRIIGFQKRLVLSGAFRHAALAHLLFAGALLRLFRPLLRRVHRAAGGRTTGDRPRRRVRLDPRRVLAYVQGELIVAEMNVFDAALALIALGHLGADARASRRRCTASSASSARAAGMARSRPMNGTR